MKRDEVIRFYKEELGIDVPKMVIDSPPETTFSFGYSVLHGHSNPSQKERYILLRNPSIQERIDREYRESMYWLKITKRKLTKVY